MRSLHEFAGAELAALLGCSTAAGEQRIADAVNVRHRQPLLWAGVCVGKIRVWVAVKVARMTAAARLTMEEARWVDSQTTPYLGTLPWGRFFALVEAKIIAADPAGAAARAEQAALARFVRVGRTEETGLKTLVARALALLVGSVLDVIEEKHDKAGAVDGGDTGISGGSGGTGGDADGTVEAPQAACLEPWQQRALWGDDTVPEPPDPEVCGCRHDPDHHHESAEPDSDLLPVADLCAAVEALAGFDATKFDPVTVFHIHATAETMAEGNGVTRVENLGPIVLTELRSWLGEPFTFTRIHCRPVLDLNNQRSVDRYEIPDPMREQVIERDPYEIFPYGTLPVRKSEVDHVIPFRDDGLSPPGQTNPDKLGPLGKRHHRIKTFGHWFRVDHTGTTHLGRDLKLDAKYVARAA